MLIINQKVGQSLTRQLTREAESIETIWMYSSTPYWVSISVKNISRYNAINKLQHYCYSLCSSSSVLWSLSPLKLNLINCYIISQNEQHYVLWAKNSYPIMCLKIGYIVTHSYTPYTRSHVTIVNNLMAISSKS